MDGGQRQAQLAQNLAAVRERVSRAARACGRDPAEVAVVVVTKFFPASDIVLLRHLGVTEVGENRAQELREKVREVGDHVEGVRVHFMGQVQTNKAGMIVHAADVVESVDRPAVVEAIGLAAAQRQKTLDVLVQWSADGDTTRGGARTEDMNSLCELIAQQPFLQLRGVMVVAPRGVPPLPVFKKAAALVRDVQERWPQACWLSAGMSGDLEEAITAGATHVRVGSAIMGQRPALGYSKE